jgi:predicted MFS family arabinose efflux permease
MGRDLVVADRCSPHDAGWITPAERNYLETALVAEKKAIAAEVPGLRDVLRNRNVILLLVLFCFLQVGFYGYGLWLPMIVKALSQGTIMLVGWITAIPWVCAMIGSLLISARADRTGDYRTHIAHPILLAALFLALSVWAGPARPLFTVGALSICLGFMYCTGLRSARSWPLTCLRWRWAPSTRSATWVDSSDSSSSAR